MKIAYWVLLVLAAAIGIFGYFNNMHWLIYVAVGVMLLATVFSSRHRRFYARKKS
jgi:hypothetical protein